MILDHFISRRAVAGAALAGARGARDRGTAAALVASQM